MSARTLMTGAIVASAALLAAGGLARMSAASYTASLTTGGNAVTADMLSNHFSVAPGPDASGNVHALAIDLGVVASPGTITGVFTVTNVSGATRTATLAVDGSQLASAIFAQSGSASATLAPGASSQVSVTTTAVVAGPGTGTVRLGLAGQSWLYRSYSVALDAAPAAPASLTATPKPAADIELSWPESETTTNLAGYNIYRSTGGSWTKRNASPVTATTWLDTSSSNGTQYSYRVRSLSSGAVPRESVDSPTATARADSSAPTRPSSVQLANGGGQGNAYLNSENSASVSVSVRLPSSSVATNVVTVTLSRNGVTATKTAPATNGAGTVTVTGIDASALADGTVTISATASDAAGNVSSTRNAAASPTKDTVAPAAPTASYVDRSGQADRITGTCQASATITATRTVPSAAGPYTTTASSGGSYTVTVARVDGSTWNPITVTYLVTATDAAGNVSAATTLTHDVTR